MMEAPTLSRFLLRSRMLWLTIFSLMFFSWAWWDSERYVTSVSVVAGRRFEVFMQSVDGGCSINTNSNGCIFYGVPVQFIRDPMYPFSGKRTPMDYWYPQTRYSTLLILTLILSTLWHAWRWHVIRKHFQATNQTNGIL